MKLIQYLIIIVTVLSFRVNANDSIYITRENATEYNVDIKIHKSEIYGMYQVYVSVGNIPTRFHCLKLDKVDIGFYGDRGPIAITPLTFNADSDISYSFYLRKEYLVRTSIGINYANTQRGSECEQFSTNAFIVELSAWKTSNSDILQLD